MKNASKPGYKFITMKRPLEHAVYNGTKVMIPAGAKRVRIAFGQSHLVRNIDTGRCYRKSYDQPLAENEVRCNVYQRSWNAPIIHG